MRGNRAPGGEADIDGQNVVQHKARGCHQADRGSETLPQRRIRISAGGSRRRRNMTASAMIAITIIVPTPIPMGYSSSESRVVRRLRGVPAGSARQRRLVLAGHHGIC